MKDFLPLKYFWNLVSLIFGKIFFGILFNYFEIINNFLFAFLAIKLIHKIDKNSDILLAEKLIETFVKQYIHLYGNEVQTFSLHCIEHHLISDVRNHGSLASHSMFALESTLGSLKSTLNGTRGFSSQYIKSIRFFFKACS